MLNPAAMSGAERRVRIAFGVWNAVAAAVLLCGVLLVVQPRFWALDVPLTLIALVQGASAVGLLANRAWAERARVKLEGENSCDPEAVLDSAV